MTDLADFLVKLWPSLVQPLIVFAVAAAAGFAVRLIVIPNSKLAQAMVTNFSLPERRLSVPVPVNVSYGSDPDRVERVLEDEGKRAIGAVPGLLAEPAPVARFAPGFVAQFGVQHELRKRILKRLAAEGIEIPTRALLADALPKGTGPKAS